jgi:hypothetical protein
MSVPKREVKSPPPDTEDSDHNQKKSLFDKFLGRNKKPSPSASTTQRPSSTHGSPNGSFDSFVLPPVPRG